MQKSSYRIDMLGTSFSIAADEDPVYLKKLVNSYQSTVHEVRESTGMKDPLKLAIIAGIIACDDALKKTQQLAGNPAFEIPEDAEAAERLTLELVDRLDRILKDASPSPSIEY